MASHLGKGSLYEACGELFADYPLAVRVADWEGTVRSMVLMLQDSDNPRFFMLTHDSGDGQPFYSFSPWRTGIVANVEADAGVQPDWVATVVTRSVPLPRHGSLFGWKHQGAVTSLIAVYVESTPMCPEPVWTVMPLAGIPEAQWPRFTGEPLFGSWFWDHYRAGDVVSLSNLVAETANTVFWVETEALFGWNCCAVARDVRSESYVLPQGRYVYYESLRSGVPVPSLETLVSDPGKTDLAPRFQWLSCPRGLNLALVT
jgi:hypothetical protein